MGAVATAAAAAAAVVAEVERATASAVVAEVAMDLGGAEAAAGETICSARGASHHRERVAG